MLLRWTCAALDGLSPRALYQTLALRSEVFVVEQRCVYLDPDGHDLHVGVLHLLGHRGDEGNGQLLACARLLCPQVKSDAQGNPMIGRVATAAAGRGQGLGRQLMQRAMAECSIRWPGLPVDIQAQAYLLDFYASLGFVAVSAPYDEDGIHHVDMRFEQ